MKIKRLHCPNCGAIARVNGSREVLPRLRTAYAQCSNPMCSASWKVNIELSKALSPGSNLFKQAAKPAHLSINEEDIAIDMAYEFISRKNKRWSRDETVEYCADYLCHHIDTISYTRASMLAARAVADNESSHLINWRIDIDQSTSTALIINHHPTADEQIKGLGHEQRVISLRELVEFIEARDQAEQDGILL